MSRYDNVEKRMASQNKSEECFEAYLQANEYSYHQIGFQNRQTNEEWKNLHPIMRYTPDFIAWIEKKPKFYEVKSATDTFLFKPYSHKYYVQWSKDRGTPFIYTICHWSPIYEMGYAFIFVDIVKMTQIAGKYESEYITDVYAKQIPIQDLIDNCIEYIKG